MLLQRCKHFYNVAATFVATSHFACIFMRVWGVGVGFGLLFWPCLPAEKWFSVCLVIFFLINLFIYLHDFISILFLCTFTFLFFYYFEYFFYLGTEFLFIYVLFFKSWKLFLKAPCTFIDFTGCPSGVLCVKKKKTGRSLKKIPFRCFIWCWKASRFELSNEMYCHGVR